MKTLKVYTFIVHKEPTAPCKCLLFALVGQFCTNRFCCWQEQVKYANTHPHQCLRCRREGWGGRCDTSRRSSSEGGGGTAPQCHWLMCKLNNKRFSITSLCALSKVTTDDRRISCLRTSPGGPAEGSSCAKQPPDLFPLIGHRSSGCHLRKFSNLSR